MKPHTDACVAQCAHMNCQICIQVIFIGTKMTFMLHLIRESIMLCTVVLNVIKLLKHRFLFSDKTIIYVGHVTAITFT